MAAKGKGVGEGMEYKGRVSRCKLLYREWINNKNLCSTQTYIQYPMIKHIRKEYKNVIRISKSLCWTAVINRIF